MVLAVLTDWLGRQERQAVAYFDGKNRILRRPGIIVARTRGFRPVMAYRRPSS